MYRCGARPAIFGLEGAAGAGRMDDGKQRVWKDTP